MIWTYLKLKYVFHESTFYAVRNDIKWIRENNVQIILRKIMFR